ncbi:hypothetical protein VF21_02860 [Pseudogymnoascus sp. 05NY08]|nr:hypothetical protein VF21_02860 [Pseudogymnoascus sp. 05NY08]
MDTSPQSQPPTHPPRQRPHHPSSTPSPPPTPPPPDNPPAPPPVYGPSASGHNRSTSLTSLKRTFSKILPANRSERGGTRRESQGRGDVETVEVDDKGEERGEQRREKGKIVKEEERRSRSWSPRKGDVMSSASDDKENGPQKEVDKEPEKGGNAFQRLLGLRRTSLPTTSTPAQNSTRRLSLRRPKGKKAIHFASPPTQIPPPTPASRSGTSTPPLDSQQMYDQKRLRREQRRSYRSSEDYLTIAGANPRTGYWDVNTAIGSTSSSEAADRARKREVEIAENRRRLEAAKQELEEALARREAEDRERDAKRARRRERDEARRREKKGREAGRWRTEGDGWRMVAEPGLSPIVGSLAGSPRIDRTPDDQLTEMRVPEEIVDKGYFEGDGREGERGRSTEEERKRRTLSRSPATPSRLSRQVGDTPGVAGPSTPMERKALPSASRVVSGDIPLYVASPSRKGGSSRKLSTDRVPELQPGVPPPSLERANPARAAIFPSPRRQPHRPPFIDAGPETPPQGPRSPAISMGRSGDNGKGSRANATPNESVRRSPDRSNHDPFGPIPRRRPASPPKAVVTPQLADTQPAVETPRLEESIPVRERNAKPEAQRSEQQPPAVVPSGVEPENRELEGSNDTIVRHSIAEALPEALPAADSQRVPSSTRKDLNENEDHINPEQSPFLGIRPDGQPEEPATATSSQSASTSPALTPHQSHQSLKDTDQGKRIKHIASMNELPPFVLKHPVTGTSLPIAPSSPKILAEVTNRSSREVIGGDGKAASITTTTTITPTTGPDGRKLRPEAFTQETANAIEQDPSTPGVTPERTKPPSERSFPTAGNRERYIVGGGSGSDTDEASYSKVVSETLARPSTSPRYHMGDPGGHPGAQNAARVALLNGDKALSLDRGVQGQRAGVGAGVHGGSPGGGNVGMSRMGSPVRIERGDKLVVWHAAPVVGPRRRRNDIPGGDEIKKHVGTVTPNASTPKPNTTGGATLQQVLIVLLSTARHLILAAWCFVEPVFDPKSALRARCERQEMTWRDGVVVAGAGLFGAAALLAAVLCVRVVGKVVRVVGVVGRGVGF